MVKMVQKGVKKTEIYIDSKSKAPWNEFPGRWKINILQSNKTVSFEVAFPPK